VNKVALKEEISVEGNKISSYSDFKLFIFSKNLNLLACLEVSLVVNGGCKRA
jgi:hypothetical protein